MGRHSDKSPRFSPVGMDEDGKVRVCCENCGSTNLNFDGWDIDKCRDCGHWRYRGQAAPLGERDRA